MRSHPLNILAVIQTYPNGNADRFAAHVAATARHLTAEVHALVLQPDFPTISSALGNMLIDVPGLIGGAKAQCRARGEAVIQALSAELASLEIPSRITKVECHPGSEGDVVASLARYHDLALLGIKRGDVTQQATAEAVVFGSGRPTLLVPDDAPPATFRRVMIAWDGSRVAARAVADAREFLQRAQAVTIISVTDEKTLPDQDASSRLAKYLARYDVEAEVALVPSRNRPISETLQQHARQIEADLLVMGGFAHSRVRDFVLGGATSGILKDLQLAVLISH